VTLVLPLWNLSTHWYTFLCLIQFSPYCANILLWLSESFTPSDCKNQMTTCCSTTVKFKSGSMLTMTAHTSLHVMANPWPA
jgi:hypothetical protein